MVTARRGRVGGVALVVSPVGGNTFLFQLVLIVFFAQIGPLKIILCNATLFSVHRITLLPIEIFEIILHGMQEEGFHSLQLLAVINPEKCCSECRAFVVQRALICGSEKQANNFKFACR